MRMLIAQAVSAMITSDTLRRARRGMHGFFRRLLGRKPTIHYFHQADDPYSILAIQTVPLIRKRYDVNVVIHAVSPPDMAAAPEPEMLISYSRRDAALLAQQYGFALDPQAVAALVPEATAETMAAGDRRRAKAGHYLGATFYFESEWFWGLDRLHYLEERLSPFRRKDAPQDFIAPRKEVTLAPVTPSDRKPVLEAFISFRSPYTYLAIERVSKLAAHYGADLQLRFVLPMVMRGLPVPLAKKLYIVRDCKREAERLGLPFGRIADPVGPGAERGLAVLHHAIQDGKGPQFADSFLRGVFAEGIDAAHGDGLMRMAKRAGLVRKQVKAALADSSWREVAEANRKDMFAAGVWGVPAFRVDGGEMLWGQDRLWIVEAQLRAGRG